MNGFRTLGKRKASLIKGAMAKQFERLKAKGIDPNAYLAKRYGIRDVDSFLKIPTKKISGIISDLAEM